MEDIELVIKISEEIYKSSKKECAENNSLIIDNFTLAIGNGTPLPKGHGKLIDATFALDAKVTRGNNGVSDRTKGWNEACQAIYENAPTIIEADKEKKDEEIDS